MIVTLKSITVEKVAKAFGYNDREDLVRAYFESRNTNEMPDDMELVHWAFSVSFNPNVAVSNG